MEKTWACEETSRIPFVPAVYEQKAYLINETPSSVARNAELLYRAMMVEYEKYQADALVIGLDVYNLEAEAFGVKVTYYDGDDTSIPGIGHGAHMLGFGDDLSKLKIPNPLKDGRMPINLEVARRMAPLHATVPIRGAVSGPFSLALSLMGAEAFFMGTLDNPDYCRQVLKLCADTVIAFGKGYLDCGVGVIMFDSQASPELFPPEMYRELVLPETQRIIQTFNGAGEKYCPLIIGGDTTAMIDSYMETGTRQILCDFKADWSIYRAACEKARMSVRRNLNPFEIQKASPDILSGMASKYIEEAEGMKGFILGTAVVPFGTPMENILAVRNTVSSLNQKS